MFIFQGCTLLEKSKRIFKILYITYLGGYCIGQLLLLGLYIHPLIRHKASTNA